MNKTVTKEIDLNGRILKLETGKLAQQADSSVLVSWGETVILATVATQALTEDLGYFPLSVEYVEKHYAGGKISSSRFIKRETKPTDEAILTGRLIDRSIRPLFPKEFRSEVQVILTVLSIDQNNDPDLVGLIGASAALSASSIPWNGPIAAIRVGERDGNLVVDPTIEEAEHLNMDLVVASTKEKVVMIEAQANQVEDTILFNGIKRAHEEVQPIIALLEDFARDVGREKLAISHLTEEIEEAVLKDIKKVTKERIEKALFDTEHPWHEATGDLIKAQLTIEFADPPAGGLTPQMISEIFDRIAKEIMHDLALVQGKRIDGRSFTEIRPITMEIGILPRTHGSALFARGDTQILSVATLGAPSLQQTLEGMEGERQKRFMHHYNMSINPFSVGEVKRLGPPNRRDIGHGSLVEKSLELVIPSEEKFPYAIRVVSEVLAANASTSMASVCATTLALLNAGVPLVEPVAGIALGLFTDGNPSTSPSATSSGPSGSGQGKVQVICDMRAIEDFYGDMDFKVSGTKNGITAIQMDTKLDGLTFETIEIALNLGRKARLQILDEMEKVIPSAGPLSPYAPRVEMLHIKPEEIGLLIGPGGKNINGIIARTGAQIDIEDDGTVMVSGSVSEGVDKAIEAIEGMFKTINVGEEFVGKVVRIAPFGVFVEIAPGKDGLVHISQMAPGHVERPEDITSVGQEVKVRVTDVTADGKIALSMLFGGDMKPESEGSPHFVGGAGRPAGRGFVRGPAERRGFGGPRRDFGHRSSGRQGFARDRGDRGGFRPRRGPFDRRRPGDRDRGY